MLDDFSEFDDAKRAANKTRKGSVTEDATEKFSDDDESYLLVCKRL